MVHVWPVLKITEIILNKQRCLLRGCRFLSNKEVMEKLGVTDFFSVKNIGSQLGINKILLGGYNILLSLCSMTTPMQITNATLNGGCIIGL